VQAQHAPAQTALTAQLAHRTQLVDRVKQILIEDLHVDRDPDAIDLDAPLFGTGLALDSVDALELVVASETAFSVRLPQDTLRSSLRTLNTLVDIIIAEQQRANSNANSNPAEEAQS